MTDDDEPSGRAWVGMVANSPQAQWERSLCFIIAHFDQFGPPGLLEVANAIGRTKTAVVKHVKRARAAGYLAPVIPRRQGILVPTAEGRRAMRCWAPDVSIGFRRLS